MCLVSSPLLGARLPPGVVLNTVPPGVVEYSWGMWAESCTATRRTAGMSRLRVARPPADMSPVRAAAGVADGTGTRLSRCGTLTSVVLHVVGEDPKQDGDFLQNDAQSGGL